MGGVQGYDTEESAGHDTLKYLFISKGKSNIIKAIEYQYVQEFSNSSLYNLAFGDYDISRDTLSDDNNSNNDDMYPVFYTVLGTIPKFFNHYPKAMLMIQGSDSTPEFEARCQTNCRRKCEGTCKKLNQRINAYRRYVDRNFEALSNDYRFYGVMVAENQNIMEEYQTGHQYNAVFLRRR